MATPRSPHPFSTHAPPLLLVSAAPVRSEATARTEWHLPATVRAVGRWGVAVRVLRGDRGAAQVSRAP